MLPESGSVSNIQKHLVGTPWSFHGILDHSLNDDGQLEFLSKWDRKFQATWETRNNVPKKAISRYFARTRRAMPDRYEKSSEVSTWDDKSKRRQQISAIR